MSTAEGALAVSVVILMLQLYRLTESFGTKKEVKDSAAALAAKIDEHKRDAEKKIEETRRDLREYRDKLDRSLASVDGKLDAVLAQALKTNGRVDTLEALRASVAIPIPVYPDTVAGRRYAAAAKKRRAR